MGLDMFAYVAAKTNQPETREIAYWRKHPDLHGYMQRLWLSQGNEGDFNGDELELTWADIDALEQAIIHKQLPKTSGFFFGNSSDDTNPADLEFVKNARAELFLGLRVFYNSSW